MSWTDERVDHLRRMWNDGESASTIAKELGGITRNAVIGKVHRLGLSNRAGAGTGSGGEADDEPGPAPEPEADPTPAPASTEPAPDPEGTTSSARRHIVPAGQPLPPQPSNNEISPETLASVREVEKQARRLSLMELTERTCKWPIGDPATSDFWFCGLAVKPGKPYCEAHVQVAFQPMNSRRDRKR